MKKILLLVFLLAGCNDSNDIVFNSELLVKYDCHSTGEYLDRRDAASIFAGASEVNRYYVYNCTRDNIGRRMSKTRLMGGNNEMDKLVPANG